MPSGKTNDRLMRCGNAKFHIRVSGLKPAQKRGDHRVFCIEMICVDQIEPEIKRSLELMVLDIGRNIRVAAERRSTVDAVSTGTTHHGDAVYPFSGVNIAQSAAP